MNKSTLLIAAVAASIAGAATADVSIHGNFKATAAMSSVNGNTPDISTELNMTVKGKSGSNQVVLTTKMANTDTSAAAASVVEAYVTTKIGGISVKAGQMKGQTGNGLTYAKGAAAMKISASTKLAGVKVSASMADNSGSDAKITVSGDFAGTSIKVQDVLSAARHTSVAGQLGSFDAKAEFATGLHAVQLSTSVAGSTVTFANIDSNNAITQDKGLFGSTAAGKNVVRGATASMPTALGTVTANYHQTTVTGSDSVNNMGASLKAGSMTYSVAKTGTDAATAKAVLSFKF